MRIYTDVDLRKNRITNAKIQTTEPSLPWSEGLIYLNTTTNKIMYYDGNNWVAIGGDGGGGGGGGGNGEENIIEGVVVNGTQLSLDSNKKAAVSFSSTGDGTLTIKNVNNNNAIIETITVGGITAGALIASCNLTSGYSTYIIQHSLGTDNLIVQVINSNDGATVGCEVTRYTSNSNHYVKIEFSEATTVGYKVIMVGNSGNSTPTITQQQ